MPRTRPARDDGASWYKDAVIYQIHVRAFHDSDGNGIGDFRGLTEKLDYLQDLGVTAIWLLPFYPSPLRDDGYDIADYLGIHPDYGTMADFKHFLKEAHRRGLKVITELVINHTSDEHPWFQRARRSPAGSAHRDFYVWSDTTEKYKDARIIFKDFEGSNWSWDPLAQAYYWHRFYHHQPDLNFDNPAVRRAVHKFLDAWLSMGVDGLRLDAIPYLFEREGSSCENLPETHGALRDLRRHVDGKYRARMLLAEANQWPEDAVAYFGKGDECHMAFHFPLMPRLFMAARMEDRYPIVDILSQTPDIPESCQWAVFLRNHDELTLEMVTDEERDYMYRVYAHDPRARINLGIRRRLAPLLGNDRRRIELMNGLLFSLLGTPVLYYGDEIGMGDNIYLGDRNGVRTPMQWSGDRNAGFSRANAQRLFLPVIIDPDYHYESVNVETQQNNPHSLLWWMRRLISLRRAHRAFSRGSLEFLHPQNRKVVAFLRRHADETLLVVANLSRYAQFLELDLAEFEGRIPKELFGGTEFPRIGELPYLLTLGPHAFLWFVLEPASEEVRRPTKKERLPSIAAGSIEALFKKERLPELESLLTTWIPGRRWFGGKARTLKSVQVVESAPWASAELSARVALVRVKYVEGEPELYVVPLALSTGEKGRSVRDRRAGEILARVKGADTDAVLHDAGSNRVFATSMLDAIARRRKIKSGRGQIVGCPTPALRRVLGEEGLPQAIPMTAEQSNTSIRFEERLILKLVRKVEPGIHPDVEIPRALAAKKKSASLVAAQCGSLEYRENGEPPITFAVAQAFVPNGGDAWKYTLDSLGRYFERVAARFADEPRPPETAGGPLDLATLELPEAVRERIGVYLESARLIGTRTGELHASLASFKDDADFAPEPFTPFYQRSLYQTLRNHIASAMGLLRQGISRLPEEAHEEAREVLAWERTLLQRFRAVADRKISAMRTRVHGDYHLGQVLYTGPDFVIIDFEGEPALPMSERRRKRSPLRDVAGMIRSFDYASHFALDAAFRSGVAAEADREEFEAHAAYWSRWTSATFLKAWLEAVGEAGVLPRTHEELALLLNVYLLDKAVYELAYELQNRPAWVRLPLRGILGLLQERA